MRAEIKDTRIAFYLLGVGGDDNDGKRIRAICRTCVSPLIPDQKRRSHEKKVHTCADSHIETHVYAHIYAQIVE